MREKSRRAVPVAFALALIAVAGTMPGPLAAGADGSDPGLAASWPMDEGSGDVLRDRGPGGNAGKIVGASWVRPAEGPALRFTPADRSRVEVPSSTSLDLIRLLTVEARVKTYGPTGTWQCILAKRDDGNYGQKVQYQLGLTPDLRLSWCICTGGPDAWWHPETGIRLEPGRWYRVAGTYDRQLRRVVLRADGVERAVLRGAPAIAPGPNPVRIGWSGWAAEHFHGEIRDVRVIDGIAQAAAPARSRGDGRPVLLGTDVAPCAYSGPDGGVLAAIAVEVLNPRDRPVRLALRTSGESPAAPPVPAAGGGAIGPVREVPAGAADVLECRVLQASRPSQMLIDVIEDGTAVARERVEVPGAADLVGFRGLVVSHTHSDLCWPAGPAACMDANVAALGASIDIAGKVPAYRFTMEHAIVLREFLRRHPERTEAVRRLLLAGSLEIGALYTGPWELTCGGEGLVRQLYLGKLWVKRTLGADPAVAWNVDVAGHTAQLPQILRKAGIRGLVVSAGSVDATFAEQYRVHSTRGPFLFRWRAPDGSELPVWSAPWSYDAGGSVGLREDVETIAARLPELLGDIARNHAAHGLPRIAFIADGTDIQAPSARVAENVARWNAEGRFPPLAEASSSELFAAVDSARLPSFAGDMPSPWDTVQAQGNACFLEDRRLEGRLLAAESFAALAAMVDPGTRFPADGLARAWEDRLYALEHNWGGRDGETSIREKTGKVRAAAGIVGAILDSSFRTIARTAGSRQPGAARILVFNQLSWDRRDVVACPLPPGLDLPGIAVTGGDGRPVPWQAVGEDLRADPARPEIAFLAEVPSLGYATYSIAAGSAPAALPSPFAADLEKLVFEGPFFRVALDPAAGGIRSIVDRRSGRELVRRSRYGLGDVVVLEDDQVDILLHLTGRTWRAGKPSSVRLVEDGPVRGVVEIAGPLLERSACRLRIVLHRDLPRIDLELRIDWEGRRNAVVQAVFPLEADRDGVRYAVPFGGVEYGKEMEYASPWPFGPAAGFPGRGARGWIEAGRGPGSVTLAAETNFAYFRDLAPDPEPGILIAPLLLRTVRSCGDGNLYYSQPGEHQFRFSLAPDADAGRSGEELNSPLLVHLAEPAPGPASWPDRLSFARVRPDRVRIAALKAAEDGRGLILRLAGSGAPAGEGGAAEVEMVRPIRKAARTSIIEEDREEAALSGGRLRAEVGEWAIETYRVEF